MGNAQQGDALPGTVGIFQPIAGLGAEKPGFRIPSPAAIGGMENTVVRNEVGQLPLAEHRKVEAIAPRQIPRGVFRCKGNAPLATQDRGPALRNKKSWNLLGYKGFQDF